MKSDSQNKASLEHPWERNTATHRWYAFGRYYAMFPPSFAYDAIKGLTHAGEKVLDPFCGRGNGPFTATVLGRPAVGIDVNPIAWLYTAAKFRPATDSDQVLTRLEEIGRSRRPEDKRGRNQFETLAWAPRVRAFLRAARRELDWKNSEVDRTLMAFIALHMQDKRGAGLSNVLWPTIACSPRYAVGWWMNQGLTRPPDVDPINLLADKIRRRYQYGIPQQAEGMAILGDARSELQRQTNIDAGLLITSPPYCGVTDYWNDHWIRLWILGYKFKKDWSRSAKFLNKACYQELIHGVLQESRRHLKEGGAVLVRSDQRRQTAKMYITAMRETWPRRKLFIRASTAPHNGISNHHGRGGRKAKEIDLLIPGKRGGKWWRQRGFQPIELINEYASYR